MTHDIFEPTTHEPHTCERRAAPHVVTYGDNATLAINELAFMVYTCDDAAAFIAAMATYGEQQWRALPATAHERSQPFITMSAFDAVQTCIGVRPSPAARRRIDAILSAIDSDDVDDARPLYIGRDNNVTRIGRR